jgi:hypothetical protein
MFFASQFPSPSSLVSTTRHSPPRHLPHRPDQYPTSRYQTHISIPSQYTPTQRHVPSRTPSTLNPGRTKQLQHSPRACTQPAPQNAPLPSQLCGKSINTRACTPHVHQSPHRPQNKLSLPVVQRTVRLPATKHLTCVWI